MAHSVGVETVGGMPGVRNVRHLKAPMIDNCNLYSLRIKRFFEQSSIELPFILLTLIDKAEENFYL